MIVKKSFVVIGPDWEIDYLIDGNPRRAQRGTWVPEGVDVDLSPEQLKRYSQFLEKQEPKKKPRIDEK